MRCDQLTHTSYIFSGCLTLFFCSLLFEIFSVFFDQSVDKLAEYRADTCQIANISKLSVTVVCSISNAKSIVQMPCMQILVNTTSNVNVLFYRNVHEKLHANRKANEVKSNLSVFNSKLIVLS